MAKRLELSAKTLQFPERLTSPVVLSEKQKIEELYLAVQNELGRNGINTAGKSRREIRDASMEFVLRARRAADAVRDAVNALDKVEYAYL
jgi:hypothetical protein